MSTTLTRQRFTVKNRHACHTSPMTSGQSNIVTVRALLVVTITPAHETQSPQRKTGTTLPRRSPVLPDGRPPWPTNSTAHLPVLLMRCNPTLTDATGAACGPALTVSCTHTPRKRPPNMKAPKRLRLGMTTCECRTSSWHNKCKLCGDLIEPSLQYVLFETFRTRDFTSCGIRHRPRIAWQVCGHAHLQCMRKTREEQ